MRHTHYAHLFHHFNSIRQRAGITQAVGKWDRDWTTDVRSAAKSIDFCVLHSVQTGYGAHPTYYTKGIGGSFLGVKRPGRETLDSLPSSAEVRYGGAMLPLVE
jgi:hypothetical protein